MDRQSAIEYLLDHYESPRNYGSFPDADVVLSGGQPDCGDQVTMYLKVDATGQYIARLTFEGEGCSISQAAASILTEMVQGAPLTHVDAMEFDTLGDQMGHTVVRHRPRCATLALGTLKAAIAQYRAGRTGDTLAPYSSGMRDTGDSTCRATS